MWDFWSTLRKWQPMGLSVHRLHSVTAALTVLFRDESLIAVDKPAGLAVHRGWAREHDVAMVRVRDQIGAHVFPVHRLDRATSGVLLFALSAPVAARVCESFATGRTEKTYLALVRGVPPEEILVDHPLPPGEDPHASKVSAQTRVFRREVFGRYSLVEARPLTGRLHQVRRHLKHLSCPLIGDVNYGKGEHNRLFRARHGLHRLFLHATRLQLPHPLLGGQLDIVSPLPADLAAVLQALREGN
jgi:tRNA pseudouridine65 synthase